MEIQHMANVVKDFVHRGPNGTARLLLYIGTVVAFVTLLITVQGMRDDLHSLITGEVVAAQASCPAKTGWNDINIRVRTCEEKGGAFEATSAMTLIEVRSQRELLNNILLKLSS